MMRSNVPLLEYWNITEITSYMQILIDSDIEESS